MFRFNEPVPVVEPAPEPELVPYVPEPLPPMSWPGVPALVGWVGIAYAVLLVMAATFGARIPSWAGWIAVVSFLTGFAILMTQLPRRRPPDAGDGAVLDPPSAVSDVTFIQRCRRLQRSRLGRTFERE